MGNGFCNIELEEFLVEMDFCVDEHGGDGAGGISEPVEDVHGTTRGGCLMEFVDGTICGGKDDGDKHAEGTHGTDLRDTVEGSGDKAEDEEMDEFVGVIKLEGLWGERL